jgi:hypothetical protein
LTGRLAAGQGELRLELTGLLEAAGRPTAQIRATVTFDRAALAALLADPEAQRHRGRHERRLDAPVTDSPRAAYRTPPVGALDRRPRANISDQFAFSIADVLQLIPTSRSQLLVDVASGALRATKAGRRTWILRQDLLDYLSRLPAREAKAPTAPTTPVSIAASATMMSADNSPSTHNETASPMRPRTGLGAAPIPSPTARRSPRDRSVTANGAETGSAAGKGRADATPRRPTPAKSGRPL